MFQGTVSIGGKFSGSHLLPVAVWPDSAPFCKVAEASPYCICGLCYSNSRYFQISADKFS